MRTFFWFFTFSFFLMASNVYGQLEPYQTDTTNTLVKEFNLIREKFQNLSLSGYIQTQFQYAQSKGIESFNGGDFVQDVDNRFLIRRGRMRIDYTLLNYQGYKKTYFAFQFDATERGVFMRDMFLRLFENKWNNFVLTSGMFNRPFGYELQMPSALRESPERGRMSQILMRTERDLGFMLSFKPQRKSNSLHHLNIDLGIFNGPGLTAPFDYDNYKDIIARISMNDVKVSNSHMLFSGGISYLNGGLGTKNQSVFAINSDRNITSMVADTASSNLNRRLPRTYYGIDARVKLPFSTNNTVELRTEYIFGTQSSLKGNNQTPITLPNEPVYIRNFNGAYFYLIVNVRSKHQFLVKYDLFDPNTDVAGTDIAENNGFTKADIKYATLGFGYSYYFNPYTKMLFYYDMPKNEITAIPSYAKDLKDNTFTIRTQLLF
jgi:hypothetical protein